MKLLERGALLALAPLTAAALLVGGCGGGNNKPTSTTATRTAPGSPSAGAPSSATQTGSAATPRTPAPVATGTGTPAPSATPDPHFVMVVNQLTPLLIKMSELPGGLRNLQPGTSGPIAISNAQYAQGRPDATAIAARLDKDGREAGVIWSWGDSRAYTPGLKLTYSVTDSLDHYQTAAGATDGFALIVSSVQPETKAPDGTVVKATQLAGAGSYGDQTQAYRTEHTFLAQAGTGNQQQTVQVTQITYFVFWRRGAALATLTLAAVNQDPSLDDLKSLATLQDERLKNAGY